MRTLIIDLLNWMAKYAAASYIAGPTAHDAISVCHQIAGRGWGSTICPWDGPNDPPEDVLSTYKTALHSISGEGLDCYLSIKAPSVKYDLKDLMEIARERGVRIHFDSLGPETASQSLLLLESGLKTYRNFSYTLPSGWRRSLADAEKIIDLGVPVRIVKGQWPDPDTPTVDPKSAFLDLVDVLAGRAAHVAIATHDASLAKESLTRLKASGTFCELEQLYGLPSRADSVAKPLGIPVRVYVPYGAAYLSYSLWEIRKRPIILAWLLKDLLTSHYKATRIHHLKRRTTAKSRRF